MGMALPAGGHLTHGWSVSITGKWFRAVQYGVRRDTGRVDMDEVRDLARAERPKLIFCGGTAIPRTIDFPAFAEIAHEVGAVLVADIAHIAGLVAGGAHPSPVGHADVISTTTHKTLRGPRGAMLMCKAEHAKAIDQAVFPGLQGGPHNHTTAAIAVALQRGGDSRRSATTRTQIVANAKALGRRRWPTRGFDLVSGGTDNHLLLVDLDEQGRPRQAGRQGARPGRHRAATTTRCRSTRASRSTPPGVRIGTPPSPPAAWAPATWTASLAGSTRWSSRRGSRRRGRRGEGRRRGARVRPGVRGAGVARLSRGQVRPRVDGATAAAASPDTIKDNHRMEIWPGTAYPLGATFDGAGTNFALFSEVADRVELCLFDGSEGSRRLPRRGSTLPEVDALRLARLPARASARASATATASTARATPQRGQRCNPAKLLLDPYAKAVEGQVDWAESLFDYRFAAPERRNDADSAPHAPKSVVINPFFDWQNDRHPRHAVPRDGHLRGARQGPDDDATRRMPRRDPRHLRRHRRTRRSSSTCTELGVTAIELMPVHQFVQDHHLRRARPAQLLGLQHDRLLRAAQRLQLGSGQRGQQVLEFKAMVRDAARAPASRSSSTSSTTTPPRATTWARRCPSAASTTRPTTGSSTTTPSTTTTRPAPATRLLMRNPHVLQLIMDSLRYWVHRDARRRVPLRPRGDAGPPVPRGRPAVGVLRPRPAGPGRLPGQADRRAVGRRRGRLPGRQLPAAVDRVERQVPRHRARLLARRARHARPSSPRGSPARATSTRSDGRRPIASINFVTAHDGFTLARPGLLQREAQRRQRRGQRRRREPQPVVELRRRGADRRPRGARRCASGRSATSSRRCCLSPGRADAAARRRARPHPGAATTTSTARTTRSSWVDWADAPTRTGR